MDYNQYSTTSYGAQGGAGGGGFLNSGSQDNSSKREYGNDTLRPVTIKQILDAEHPTPEDCVIDGQPITQITFVGQIRNISTQVTNYTYKIDDGTGTIEVKVWIDPDNQGPKPELSENVYVRVYGRLRTLSNRTHVGALTVRPVEDHNEVQYHLLEATAVHLFLTKGPLDQKSGSTKQENGDQQMGGMSNGNALPAGLSANAKRVYNCVKNSEQSNEGLHLQAIAVALSMSTADVARAGAELLDSGSLYTTVDDDTWAILDDNF